MLPRNYSLHEAVIWLGLVVFILAAIGLMIKVGFFVGLFTAIACAYLVQLLIVFFRWHG
ncbi:MAG: hypothetical protein Q7U98_17265 [Methylicorpusculum sp.]|uniref:hypothetical protein n=1 Tax=Methylicorpusculum sp. TaxID=2713644 RepID=UPI0027170E03|nr:hypothetical protein [Methylicorpusculum sp.]MDO8940907.1 hypothetical protein [Methylicorpusculum sp.]MDP2202402.1 hypothetical protein [Methylicorpusculum sp.]